MKISSSISYPYPVWGWKDDYNIEIDDKDISITEISDKDNFIYELELKANNSDIAKLIENEEAIYACIVNCSETYYHNCTVSKLPKFVVSIPRCEVNGLVKVQWMIISTKDIIDFKSDKLNEDYQGKASFPLGAMIGYITSFEINASLSDNLLSLDDIVKVVKNTDSDEIEYCYNAPIILIKLPEKLLQIFNDYGSKGPYPAAMHSTIVYQALLRAVAQIHAPIDENYQWVNIIRQCIDLIIDDLDIPSIDDIREIGYSIEDCIQIVDKILKEPFKRLLIDIETEEVRPD